MKPAYTSLTILLVFCVQSSIQLGSGAPSTACAALLPNHRGILPQETPSPYELTPTIDQATGNVLIRISAADRSVAGLLIQGRRVTDNTSVGSFISPGPSGLYQPTTCVNLGDSATHTNPQLKNEVVLQWIPPTGFNGQVYFTGTVLQEFAVFWGGVRSPIITI